ncbi:response regulator [Patiriisocius sp. Uisw_047]|uniref:response regulator n=1 Tax=Patiriisocius sp. Uisw_047 TaxID=3230969 RepID=UPI0039EB8614
MNFAKKYHLLLPILVLFSVFSLQAQQEKVADSNLVRILELKNSAKIATINQKFDNALVDLNKAYRFALTTNIDSIRYNLKLQIAELHYYIHNFDKANTEADLALVMLPEMADPILFASVYTLKGLIATQLIDFTTAEDYFTKADKIYIDVNNENKRADVLLGLGILELKRNENSKAINYFDAVLPVFKKTNRDHQTVITLLGKAEALLAIDAQNSDNLASAEDQYNKAFELIDTKTHSSLKLQSYQTAAKIAMAKGDSGTAIRLFKKYTKARDSNFQQYIIAISSSVDEEANVADLKEKLALLETEKKKDDQSLNFIKYTTGLSIALIVILSLLTLSLYKNNNLRAKANNLLLDKNTELQLSKEKAEQASLAKAQFLSTVTHELRTPLYAVTGLTHLLLEEDPKPDQKEHLNSLKFSGEYLLSLINNILDLNKLEANKVEIEQTTFDLKRRINDVLIALKKSAEDKKNNLTLEFDPSVPEKLVGDPVKLSQVLINLIGNSLKFTQNGFVAVRVNKVEDKGNRIMLHFEIEDDGVGISKKKQKTIFESFSQASLQVNRKFGGTGLGLSIVKNILELMNSKIQLESQLGKGSKFWFNISFDKVESIENRAVNNIPAVVIDFDLFEDKHILVVEDNKINQMITRKILEKNKIICQVADNGLDAIKLIETNNFDLVLMDIHMPGISGIEATKKVRKFKPDLPIIALTAVTIDENLDEFYKAGFNDIIPKPFKTEVFFEKIYNILLKNQTVL